MIYSVGVDIVDIARIENVIHRWGDAFLKKILTPLEYEYCHSKVGLAASVAARFAVKEAVYKALPAKVQVGAGWLHFNGECRSGRRGHRSSNAEAAEWKTRSHLLRRRQ